MLERVVDGVLELLAVGGVLLLIPSCARWVRDSPWGQRAENTALSAVVTVSLYFVVQQIVTAHLTRNPEPTLYGYVFVGLLPVALSAHSVAFREFRPSPQWRWGIWLLAALGIGDGLTVWKLVFSGFSSLGNLLPALAMSFALLVLMFAALYVWNKEDIDWGTPPPQRWALVLEGIAFSLACASLSGQTNGVHVEPGRPGLRVVSALESVLSLGLISVLIPVAVSAFLATGR